MTTTQRQQLPDSLHTNGAAHNPWWANAVVYQVYPRSFQDSDGDGIGDLNGIRSRLDYLAWLGVDVIWLGPVYRSPQADNGYDISDYQDIDPVFGTLADMDALIREVHRLGMRLVMDLVVNHTSDEHPWFVQSRHGTGNKADWYWWRDGRVDEEGNRSEPNRWGSTFGGPAWTWDEERGAYYLHTFSRHQPDLNWENPAVRQAVYDMMNWWLDRGVDGFRMDVITLISKRTDPKGHLPGEPDGTIEDLPAGEEGYSSPWPFSTVGPRLDEFLQEMHHEVFSGRDGTLTVGEGQGVSPERNASITDPGHPELDMVFLFDHMEIDQGNGKWDVRPFELPALKKAMDAQQRAVRNRGWASLYFGNHDQPRIVSRWGDTSTTRMRVRSAKALALLLHLHKGTPYIYQGDELGMTNAGFRELEQYRDLEALNAFHQRVELTGVQTAASMMQSLALMGRDNARTPMQWDSSKYAGFTEPTNLAGTWIDVNRNKTRINMDRQCDDETSVLEFYRRLIDLRHRDMTVVGGDFAMVDMDDPHVYAFTRTDPDRRLLVVVNVSSQRVPVPEETARLLGEAGVDAHSIVIADEPDAVVLDAVSDGELEPWLAFVVDLDAAHDGEDRP